MTDTSSIKKIDINKTDWRSSRDFFQSLEDELRSLDDKDEKYDFTWVGKRKAIIEAGAPINKTLRPDEKSSKNWDKTENLFIEGDNLDALKLLQESYLGKVKMIYIDPPYNTGKDFVYHDNFKANIDQYKEDIGYKDEDGNILEDFRRNEKSNGRYHSDWLSMMYPRLKLARNLLSDNGVIFISIDDNEQANLKRLCDEIFGEDNFIGCAGRITKKSNNKGDFWSPNFDYVLSYVKNVDSADEFFGGVNYEAYNLIEQDGPRKGEKYQLVRLYMSTIQNRNPEQRYWIDCPDGSKVIPPGKTFPPERPELGDGIWRWTRQKFESEREKIVVKQVKSSNLLSDNKLPAKFNVFTKTYLNDVINNSSAKPNSFIEDHINQIASHELNALGIPFDYAKPTTLIKYLCEVSKTNKDDIVLDFFSGSASSAHAVMQLNAEDGGNRKWIMVQLPEETPENSEARKAGFNTISEIARERIRRAGDKIAKEHPDAKVDYGFRSLVVADTSFKDVYKPVSEVSQASLLETVDNIKEDRTALDLLYSVLVQLALELNRPIETRDISGSTVYLYDYLGEVSGLAACFSEKVSEDAIKHIASLKPLTAVFRDSSFVDSQAKVNLAEHFRVISPDTKVRVI